MTITNTLQKGDRVKITTQNGEEKFGTLVQVRSKIGQYDVELDGVDYSKTNTHFHNFNKNSSTVEAL